MEIAAADFVPPAAAITAQYEPGAVSNVMLHDGGWVRLRKIAEDYDPTDRDRSYAFIRERQVAGEIATGLLYISPDSVEMHDQLETAATPLGTAPARGPLPRQRRAGEAAAPLPVTGRERRRRRDGATETSFSGGNPSDEASPKKNAP